MNMKLLPRRDEFRELACLDTGVLEGQERREDWEAARLVEGYALAIVQAQSELETLQDAMFDTVVDRRVWMKRWLRLHKTERDLQELYARREATIRAAERARREATWS